MLTGFKFLKEAMGQKEQHGPLWMEMPELGTRAQKTQGNRHSPTPRCNLLHPVLSGNKRGSLSRGGSGLGSDEGAPTLSAPMAWSNVSSGVSPFTSSSRRNKAWPSSLAPSLPLSTSPDLRQRGRAGASGPNPGFSHPTVKCPVSVCLRQVLAWVPKGELGGQGWGAGAEGGREVMEVKPFNISSTCLVLGSGLLL